MKLKNISQSVSAQAALLLPPGAVTPDQINAPAPEDVEAARAQLSPETKKALDLLGVQLPSDLLPVTLTLGSLLFDIHYADSTPPEAPLRRALYERARLDFAGRLNQDSFELTADEAKKIEQVLSDDAAWEKVRVTVHAGGPDEETKKYFTFPSGIALNFNLVLGACVEAYQPAKVEAKKAEAKKEVKKAEAKKVKKA